MAARRLKLRISRLLQSCRSNDSSNPFPSSTRLPPLVDLTPHHHRRRSFTSWPVQSTPIPCGGCGSVPPPGVSLSRAVPRDDFYWKHDADFHVVVAAPTAAAPRRKICSSSASDGGGWSSHAPPLERRKRRTRNRKRRSALSFRQRVSTSSGDSGIFSCEKWGGERREELYADETTETLLISSSRSFSTDTSSDDCIRKDCNAPERKKPTRNNRSRSSMAKSGTRNESSPARLSVAFRRLAPPCIAGPPPGAAAGGKLRESFAVVKRSECPYEDFKGSMMEMITEREMVEEGDLEELLLCFLSLNSSCHHRAIVAAFCEIWEALFGRRRSSLAGGFQREIEVI